MRGAGEGALTEADVRAAQVVLDLVEEVTGSPTGHRLDARGAVAGVLADVRTAGYLEGVQEGRREAACVVLDALRGEGLAL